MKNLDKLTLNLSKKTITILKGLVGLHNCRFRGKPSVEQLLIAISKGDLIVISPSDPNLKVNIDNRFNFKPSKPSKK